MVRSISGKTLILGAVMATSVVTLGATTVSAQQQALPGARAPIGAVSQQAQIFIPEDAAADIVNLDVPAGTAVDANGPSAALDEYWTPERMANAIPLDSPADSDPALALQVAPISAEPTKSRLSDLGGLLGPGNEGITSEPALPLETEADAQGYESKIAAQSTNAAAAAAVGTTAVATRAYAQANGRVFIHNQYDGKDYTCSGSAVNSSSKSLVATAGHCVIPDAGKDPFQNWTFVPNYSDIPFIMQIHPYGKFQADKFYVLDGWKTYGDGDLDGDGVRDTMLGHASDVAFVSVHTQVKNMVSTGKRLVEVVGGHGLINDAALSYDVNIFGYPAIAASSQSSCWGRAERYYFTTGGYTEFVGISGCTIMGEGASGGPWLRSYNPSNGYGYIGSVNSLAQTLDPGGVVSLINLAPKFGSNVSVLYNAANSGL